MTEQQAMSIPLTRRKLLTSAGLGLLVLACSNQAPGQAAADHHLPIIDSHLHVWDLKQFRLPWLDRAGPLLDRDYSIRDYLDAAKGLNLVESVYVEVNVSPEQRVAEAQFVADLCRRSGNPIAAGVIGGDPRDPAFGDYLAPFMKTSAIAGVRFFYPPDGSSDAAFLKGLRLLGKLDRTFDLQLGPDLLSDAAKTVRACPDTRFILDHCGGAEPRFFRKNADNATDARGFREQWQSGIALLAKSSNIWCKISGIADAALPGDATARDVAAIVNFCLDQFGPDRVLFGSNWPVCLKGTTIRHWVESLEQLVALRSAEDRRKLFSENARRAYRLLGPKAVRQ